MPSPWHIASNSHARSFLTLILVCTGALFASCDSGDQTSQGPDSEPVAASAPQGVTSAVTLAAAKTLAHQSATFIVVDFWHPACGHCRRFDQPTREDADMQAALADLVLLKLNVQESEGGREAALHHVHQFPTYQLLNARGEVIDTWIGYHNPQWWIARLEQALADPVTWDERRARFEGDPTVADALALGKVAFTKQRCREALEYLNRAQQLDPAAAEAGDAPIFLFRAAYEAVGIGEMSIPELGEITEDLLHSKNAKPADVVEIGVELLEAIANVGPEPVLPYVRLARSVLPEQCTGEWEIKRRRFLVDYALLVEQDSEKAVALKRRFLPDGWESDPGQLNSFAWWCFERQVNSTEAEQLARRAVEMATAGPGKANYLDTLAELLNRRGERNEALRLVEQALSLDPASTHLQEQRQRFLQETESH